MHNLMHRELQHLSATPVPAALEKAAPRSRPSISLRARVASCHQLGLVTFVGHVIALPHDRGTLLVHEHAIMNLLAGSRERERKSMNELGKRE